MEVANVVQVKMKLSHMTLNQILAYVFPDGGRKFKHSNLRLYSVQAQDGEEEESWGENKSEEEFS